jgi:predicted metal-dependent hydrolase
MLDELSVKTGISYKKCSFRLQYGRWGSCTSRGHISLNAQLLLFPPGLVEYVMIHELCHLRHMNHSPAFHGEVARFLPDWEVRRHALQERGRKLPDYLRKF